MDELNKDCTKEQGTSTTKKDTGKYRRGGKPHRSKGESYKGKPGNDVSYWLKFKTLMDNAARVAFNYIPGTELVLSGTSGASANLANFAVINYIPTPGICSDSSDAFNLWARSLYLELHRKYRGLGSYEWEDLGIVTFCILDVFGRIAEAEGIYGILNSYPLNNRIKPEGILKALGFTNYAIQQMISGMADGRYQINRLIAKAAQLCLPKGMSYLKNRVGMNAFLYADSKNKRASYIKYKQTVSWKFLDTYPTGSAAISVVRDFSNITSWGTYLNELEQDIERLLNSTDVARMCSDMLAAFGDSGVDKLAPMPEDYVINAIYDESILHKFHNIESLGKEGDFKYGTEIKTAAELTYLNSETLWTAGKSLLIKQDNGSINFEMYVTPGSGSNGYQSINGLTGVTRWGRNSGTTAFVSGDLAPMLPEESHLLDTWKEEADIEVIVEGSLVKFNQTQIAWTDASTPGNNIVTTEITSCATEICAGLEFFQIVKGNVVASKKAATLLAYSSVDYAFNEFISKFDWAPYIFAYTWGSTSLVLNSTTGDYHFAAFHIIGDVDNCAGVAPQVIHRIHDAALLSAFVFDGQTFYKE